MNCPICDSTMVGARCPECGYDATRDYGLHPTFSPLPGGIPTPARLRADRSGLMRCSKCGSDRFQFRYADRNLSCPRCGHLLSPQEMDTVLAIMGCAPLHHQPAAPKPGAPKKLGITAVSAGYAHTAVLYSDGTVRAVGSSRDGQCDTGHWRNIVAIAAGYDTTVGLKEDGTIVSTKHFNQSDPACTGIASIAAGAAGIVCVQSRGTVVFPWSGIRNQDWSHIKNAASSWHMVLGAKADGTVAVFRGDDVVPRPVSCWQNIVAVAPGFSHVAGLRWDHTVLSSGDNTFGQCDTDRWRSITAISVGDNHTVGLKADGTVVAAGTHADGRCDVGRWKNVTAVSAGGSHTVALCADGQLLAVGNNREGQCAVARLIPISKEG